MNEDIKIVFIAIFMLTLIIGGLFGLGHIAVSIGTRADNNQLERWQKCMDTVQDDIYCKDLIYPQNRRSAN